MDAWDANPIIRIREFDHISRWVTSTLTVKKPISDERIDLFPTIAWNGDVVFFSPELHSFKTKEHNGFIVGNVLKTSLFNLMERAFSSNVNYVHEYLEGVEMCKNDCPYFKYCRGGHASNKYAEHGKLNVTETISCRNSRKRLINAILENKIELKNDLELNALIQEKINNYQQLKNLISHQSKYLQASKLGSDYDKFNDFNDWNDFDKITFAEWDDDGNQTGITIGGK